MKKYIPPCVLFFANNEIVTLIALLIISGLLLIDMTKWFSERKW